MFYELFHRDRYRYASFLVLNTSLTLLLTVLILVLFGVREWGIIQPIFVTMAVLATVAFAVLYPILCRLPPGIWRFVALYVAFVMTLLLLVPVSGVIQSAFLSDSPVTLDKIGRAIVFQIQIAPSSWIGQSYILLIGHMLGFPALLVIAAVNKVLSPRFLP